MPLTWADLLIDTITPDEFGEWIGHWAGFVEGTAAPAFLTKFGHWFLRRPDGPVDMLDVYDGSVARVAASYETFIAEVNQPWWQEVYLLSELVARLHAEGTVAGPGQCYALPHPAVGGPNPMNDEPIETRFVTVMDAGLWQMLCARFVQGPPRP